MRNRQLVLAYHIQAGIKNGEYFARANNFTADADRLSFAASSIIDSLEAAGFRITRMPGAKGGDTLMDGINALADARESK